MQENIMIVSMAVAVFIIGVRGIYKEVRRVRSGNRFRTFL